ncbi:hypothetical protein H8K90_05250 [Winogradskyella echinorum]|uniref:Uncharacterized protein n=1 Tax=Winogradskyella echinorum TaxID=538189 RepID=A0ABR6XZF8_9FLAO|nr:hypothetical protein [Winogradskyella echinorum]MBC3845774.1 hypothetical protein [Winogradskyella echinorum]MBC5750122.1 hypothetical protein [Winogradskyella echinorum]
MKTSTKASLYVFLIFLVTYLILRFSIQMVFGDINTYLLSAISAALTVVLSPQRRIVRKQSGDQIQLKWLFSKKVIILK